MGEREEIVAYLRSQALIHAERGTVGSWSQCLSGYANLVEQARDRDQFVRTVIAGQEAAGP